MSDGRTVVILGASGGIGSELFQLAVADPAVAQVIATQRQVSGNAGEHAEELAEVKACWLPLDYLAPASVDTFVSRVQQLTDKIDHLFCATGSLHTDTHAPEKRLDQLHQEALQQSFAVNASGPLLAFAGLSPLLQAAAFSKSMFLTAQVGSIADNRAGGWYAYRMAKAALNMGVRTAAIESGRWRNPAIVTAVHPGTTHSALSRPFVARRSGVRAAADTAAALYDLMERLTIDHTGTFVTNSGAALPW